MAAAITVPSRKRPSPDAADAGKKKKRRTTRYGYELDDINEYEMVSEIGEGALGLVAKARHRGTGETVAVKWVQQCLDDGGGLLRAVVREAGCLAACRGHANIVQVKTVAADERAGDLYIVMELVNDGGGATLRSHLAARGPFSEDEAREVMRQLLMAAEHLRATGTIHRDINPDNILVVVTGGADGGETVVKLCGFGCATPESRVRRMVGVGSLRHYCAPEQLWGTSKYGPEADAWALGCVMAEMLAGEPLFTAAEEGRMKAERVALRDEIASFGAVVAFEDTALNHVSWAGREVLAGLLAFDSHERLTAAEALQHPWFTCDWDWDWEEEEEFQEEDQEEEDPIEMTSPGFDTSIAAPAA